MASSNGKILAAFLAGIAAGAGLGLLLAPDKGSNTRANLRKSLGDLTDKAKNSIDELTEKAKEQIQKVKPAVHPIPDDEDELS